MRHFQFPHVRPMEVIRWRAPIGYAAGIGISTAAPGPLGTSPGLDVGKLIWTREGLASIESSPTSLLIGDLNEICRSDSRGCRPPWQCANIRGQQHDELADRGAEENDERLHGFGEGQGQQDVQRGYEKGLHGQDE